MFVILDGYSDIGIVKNSYSSIMINSITARVVTRPIIVVFLTKQQLIDNMIHCNFDMSNVDRISATTIPEDYRITKLF